MIQVSGIPGIPAARSGRLRQSLIVSASGTISFWWERWSRYYIISRGPIFISVTDCQLVPPDAMAKPCSHNVSGETDSQCPMLSRERAPKMEGYFPKGESCECPRGRLDRVGLLLLESGEHGNTLVLCVRPDLVDANAMVIGRKQLNAVAEGWQSG